EATEEICNPQPREAHDPRPAGELHQAAVRGSCEAGTKLREPRGAPRDAERLGGAAPGKDELCLLARFEYRGQRHAGDCADRVRYFALACEITQRRDLQGLLDARDEIRTGDAGGGRILSHARACLRGRRTAYARPAPWSQCRGRTPSHTRRSAVSHA